MLLHLNAPNGDSVPVEVAHDTTLAGLTEEVAAALGVPSSGLGLVYAGTALERDEDLQGLDDGGELDVLFGETVVFDRSLITDNRSTDTLRAVEGLEHVLQSSVRLSAVRTTAAVFKDQWWGNTKGEVFLALHRGGVLQHHVSLLGQARRDAPETNAEKYITDPLPSWEVAPGDVLSVMYRVGGGGGHTIRVKDLHIEVASGYFDV